LKGRALHHGHVVLCPSVARGRAITPQEIIRTVRRVLLVCALGLGLPASAGQQARWAPGEAIPVWIQSEGAPPWAPALIRKALRAWTEAAEGAARFEEIASPPEWGIRVGFGSGRRHFGEAYPSIDRTTGLIVRADIFLSLDSPGDHLHKELVVYLTALHELGHALGLAHTDDFDAIMYRFRGPTDPERYFLRYRKRLRSEEDIGKGGATGLFPADLRALKLLYP
jgi:hypothetical protein